jgi:parallel beta-helix repeat protein
MGLAHRLSVIFLGGVILLALFLSSHRAMAASMEGKPKNDAVRPLLPMIPPVPILQEESIARPPTSIQALIDAAAPGAVVEVAAGTYTEQLRITKPLTLTAAPGATVLLQGDGSGIAVTINATHDVRVANLSISAYTNGIIITNSTNIALYGNHLANSNETSLLLQWSENCSVVNNTIDYTSKSWIDYTNKSWSSLYIFSSPSCSFINNTINARKQSKGFTIESSVNSTVIGNLIENCRGDGIRIWDSGPSIIRTNTIYNSSMFGLGLLRSANSTITGNTISNSTNTGLYLHSSGNSTVMGNTIVDSGWNGLLLRASNHSTVAENTIHRSILPGLYLAESVNCTVSANLIESNWTGLQLYAADQSVMECWRLPPSPSRLGPGEPVIIRANVSNPFGLRGVLLSFTTGNAWTNQTMEFNASQKLYVATIPGQQAETTIQVRLYAQDQQYNWFRSEIWTYIPTKTTTRQASSGYLWLSLSLGLVFLAMSRVLRRLGQVSS